MLLKNNNNLMGYYHIINYKLIGFFRQIINYSNLCWACIGVIIKTISKIVNVIRNHNQYNLGWENKYSKILWLIICLIVPQQVFVYISLSIFVYICTFHEKKVNNQLTKCKQSVFVACLELIYICIRSQL